MAWINPIPKDLQLEMKTLAQRPNPWGILPMVYFYFISAQGLPQAWLMAQVMESQNSRITKVGKELQDQSPTCD